MSFKITVSGVDEVFAEINAKVKSTARKGEAEKASEIKNKLVSATPVDTGEAKAGWRLNKEIKGFSISNDVDHIGPLNSGSSKQAPSRFIEKTVLSVPGVKPNGAIVKDNN
jgi:hypothetical protein